MKANSVATPTANDLQMHINSTPSQQTPLFNEHFSTFHQLFISYKASNGYVIMKLQTV